MSRIACRTPGGRAVSTEEAAHEWHTPHLLAEALGRHERYLDTGTLA